LEHLRHGRAGVGVGLVVVGARHGHAQLGAQLRLGQPVGAQRVFGVVGGEIGIAAGGGDPDRGEGGGATARRGSGKLLHRGAQAGARSAQVGTQSGSAGRRAGGAVGRWRQGRRGGRGGRAGGGKAGRATAGG